jgi:hypothetical protein
MPPQIPIPHEWHLEHSTVGYMSQVLGGMATKPRLAQRLMKAFDVISGVTN